ncbi:MAG: hypothetical protein ABIR24_02260 [Verrucomicrobiota bacterium]
MSREETKEAKVNYFKTSRPFFADPVFKQKRLDVIIEALAFIRASRDER